MIRLLTAVLFFASFHAVAQITLTELNNNTPADADDVMGNFNALNGALPPTNCATNQIIKWNGSGWECATDPLANLSCAPGEGLVYRYGTVDCSCERPGTAITDSNFSAAVADWLSNGNASEYGDITKWCTRAVTDMSGAFQDANSFNSDISGWDTRNVTNMENMFAGAEVFNQDIGGWDVGNVENMEGMFSTARAFDQDINGWNVSSVNSMYRMFSNANAFNKPIAAWNVSAVTNMGQMFWNAIAFDQPLSGWDVSSVEYMHYMFIYAASFNQPIGNWNVSNVESMSYMFMGAAAFNQDLSIWDASALAYCTNFAKNANAWLAAYSGSIQNKKPPLSDSLIDAGCGTES